MRGNRSAQAGAFRQPKYLPTQVEIDDARAERARERRRIRDILSVEYSWDEIQIISANMRREMERRWEIEELFGELSGKHRQEAALYLTAVRSSDRKQDALTALRARPMLYEAFRRRANAFERQRWARMKAADPERYEAKLRANRTKKLRWYVRNAEHAKEQERQRRHGPSGAKVRARDRERYHARRDERLAAAKARLAASPAEARRKRREKQREWYLRNRERVLARVKTLQSDADRRAAKKEYDRARYAAGVQRKAA